MFEVERRRQVDRGVLDVWSEKEKEEMKTYLDVWVEFERR